VAGVGETPTYWIYGGQNRPILYMFPLYLPFLTLFAIFDLSFRD
jgi:hypothetical protein